MNLVLNGVCGGNGYGGELAMGGMTKDKNIMGARGDGKKGMGGNGYGGGGAVGNDQLGLPCRNGIILD